MRFCPSGGHLVGPSPLRGAVLAPRRHGARVLSSGGNQRFVCRVPVPLLSCHHFVQESPRETQGGVRTVHVCGLSVPQRRQVRAVSLSGGVLSTSHATRPFVERLLAAEARSPVAARALAPRPGSAGRLPLQGAA